MKANRFLQADTAFAIAVVAGIWVLSLLPSGGGGGGQPGIDKLHHAVAYFTAMLAAARCLDPRAAGIARARLALGLIAMGVLLECLQGLTPTRSFEVLDMLANAAGVSLAWFALALRRAARQSA